jgi:type II secretion system protein E
MAPASKKPLGQLLLDKEIISQEQLEIALKKQAESGELLGATLIKLGFVDEEAVLLSALADQLSVDMVDLKSMEIPPSVILMVPAKFATHYKIVPVSLDDGVLTIATSHPRDIEIIDGMALVIPSRIRLVLAGEKDIAEAIRKYYGVGAETIDQMMDSAEVKTRVGRAVEHEEDPDSEASVGKLVNQILLEACRDRATDIHIEPFEKDLKVRYRVDGILYDTKLPTNILHFKEAINSRIKIMSSLDIAEKRLPQDGRFKARVADMDMDLRVSFLPTQFGESVVIRILSSNRLYHMEELGISKDGRDLLDDLLKRPHGIIFLTGPTGSGKTTTLYSCLARMNKADLKIITIEDPIEYQLKGVTQIQINPAIGLTFAQGLRSMLRHDPDVMMVGEVRDLETAQIAVQVALTGHLVFSTLHTNDAASGVTRLIDMGIEPYLVASSVHCFIAQRLIRRLCPKCKVPAVLSPEVANDLGLNAGDIAGVRAYEAKGCEACHNTGYHGREGIYEFLILNDQIAELILNRSSAAQVKHKAVAMGMRTLLQDGWDKVKSGITSPSEIIRVTKDKTI